MRVGQVGSRNRTEISLPKLGDLLQQGLMVAVVLFGPIALSGCAGLVSGAAGANTTPPPSALQITNVQVASTTTSTCQIVWTTNVPADSGVDYGSSVSYGSSTTVDPSMVTNHAVTVSGLAPAAIYYYQVRSTDSKSNHGQSGGRTFKTSGLLISGAISPAAGAAGATVTLSGPASAIATADSSGNYAFSGLGNGTYTVAPSHTGYTFSPSSQNVTVNGTNLTGVNFTDTLSAVAPSITTQPASQTVTAGQAATFTVVATGTAPLTYQWEKSGVNIAGAMAASYTTPATSTSDSGAVFAVVISNTAGTVTSSTATLTVNAAPAPAIQVSPTPINFGNAVVGTNLSQALIIKNSGTAALTISQVTATGSGFGVSGFSLPLNINAGQQTSITVAFLPAAVGSVSGNISIASNASTSPTSVGLSGTGIAATLTLGISPTSLIFGNVTTGTSSAAQNILISDTGNSSVTISQITLSGTGYSMTGGNPPATLNPSQTITISVQFSPIVAGTANGNISIVSNATGSPAAVSLTGAGIAPTQHSVALSWGASPSTVVGYNIYRSTVSGSLFARVNGSVVAGLAYTDTSVQTSTAYYYVATAVDAVGNESVFSNQVQAVVP